MRSLGKVDLNDILRRALAIGEWMATMFEAEVRRLARQIEDAKKRKSFPPAAASTAAPAYNYRRRTSP